MGQEHRKISKSPGGTGKNKDKDDKADTENRGSEEMAQLVRFLPCKHEGLISIPQNLHLKASCAYNPSSRMVQTCRALGSLASLA